MRRWQSHRERYGSCRVEFGSPVDMARRIDGLFPLSFKTTSGRRKKTGSSFGIRSSGFLSLFGVDRYMIYSPFLHSLMFFVRELPVLGMFVGRGRCWDFLNDTVRA